jgi:hypothetical protein
MVKFLAVTGLVVALAGVLILFRFGMPYRVESGGATYLVTEEIDHAEVTVERLYRRWGWVGLCLVVAGTALQIASVLLA